MDAKQRSGAPAWIIALWVVNGILMAILAGWYLMPTNTQPTNTQRATVGTSPLRTVELRVPRPSREEFFAQLASFASAHGFTIHIGRIHPVKEQFGVDMFRHDVHIGADSIWDPAQFRISFYSSALSDLDYDKGAALVTIDPLFADLKQRLEQVQGVIVTQKK
jgi:hypothetical protein